MTFAKGSPRAMFRWAGWPSTTQSTRLSPTVLTPAANLLGPSAGDRVRGGDAERDGRRGHGGERLPHRGAGARPRSSRTRSASSLSGEVRGLGVFWAIELVGNPETREPLAPYGGTSPAMNAAVAACKVRRHAALRELQPHPCLPTVQRQRCRDRRGACNSRRCVGRGRRARGALRRINMVSHAE